MANREKTARKDVGTGRRQPLSDGLGRIRCTGSKAFSAVLSAAFEATEAPPDALTHGFHSYPARMHYGMARHLLGAFGHPGGTVLDPFCGGGTVPIEAMLAGMAGVGTDLNPLAIRIAAVKSEIRGSASRERFLAALFEVAEASEERVRGRERIRAPLPKHERDWYAPHTLLELAGLFEEISSQQHEGDREALRVLFSAIVGKFAQQRADTHRVEQPKRIRKGLPTEFFVRKGQELVRRWSALEAALRRQGGKAQQAKAQQAKAQQAKAQQAKPQRHASPSFHEADIRALPKSLPAADLILTSPPYPGVYDYAEHHARRFAWLGVQARNFEKRELAPRRRQHDRDAQSRYRDELFATLAAMRKAMRPNGAIVMLLGDGRFQKKPVEVAPLIEAMAPELHLSIEATATVFRPDRGGAEGRPEHLIYFAPSE